MSKQAANRFLEAVAEPPQREEFQGALGDSVEAMVALGERKGFHFSPAELCEAISELMKDVAPPDVLTEVELQTVAGGRTTSTSTNNLKQLGLALHNYNDTSLSDVPFWEQPTG